MREREGKERGRETKDNGYEKKNKPKASDGGG